MRPVAVVGERLRETGLGIAVVAGSAVFFFWVVLALSLVDGAPSITQWGGNQQVMLIFSALTCLAAALAFRTHRNAQFSLTPATAVSLVVGTALWLAAQVLRMPLCAQASVPFLGIACGLFEVTYYRTVARLPRGAIPLCIVLVAFTSALLVATIPLFPLPWFTMLFVFAPFLALALLTVPLPVVRAAVPTDVEPCSPSSLRKVIVANLIVAVAFNFVVECARADLPQQAEGIVGGRIVANVLACAVMFALVLRPGAFDAARLYRVVLPIMVGGLFLFYLLPPDYAAAAVVCEAFGYQFFDINLSMAVMLAICDLRLDAGCFGALYTSSTLGGMALAGFAQAGLRRMAAPVLYGNVFALFAVVVALLVAVALVLPESAFAALMPGRAKAPGARSDTVAELGRSHGLTAREQEVFAMLARGRTARVVAKELDVTVGTARTHIAHVYGKLGVHSQQELIDAVEAADRLD